MKVGSEPVADPGRVGLARAAIGPDTLLFVDANGACDRKQALAFADLVARDFEVRWFEEPVSSDDLEGLRLIRDRAPPGLEVTAGEYAYTLYDFRRLIETGAVDVVQPDATRCMGVTGVMQAAALCRAQGLPLSAHTAPSLHAHLCCAADGEEIVQAFRELKGIFDPDNRMTRARSSTPTRWTPTSGWVRAAACARSRPTSATPTTTAASGAP